MKGQKNQRKQEEERIRREAEELEKRKQEEERKQREEVEKARIEAERKRLADEQRQKVSDIGIKEKDGKSKSLITKKIVPVVIALVVIAIGAYILTSKKSPEVPKVPQPLPAVTEQPREKDTRPVLIDNQNIDQQKRERTRR